MKKALMMVVAISGMSWANNVTDTLNAGQSPNPGDILYYSGISGNTAGTWAQPSSIPGLQGPQGEQGIQGEQGLQGDQGIQGETGAAGADGANGSNGADGADGKDGDNGKDGKDGKAGANGTNASIDHNLFLNVGAQVRWYDMKHVAFVSGYRYDVNHFNHTVDMLVVQIKLGKSHEERLLEKQNREIKQLHMLVDRLLK